MRPPCEAVVRFVLPTLRSILTKQLIEEYNLSQVETAKRLGTTQAAISHYRSSKRGKKLADQLEAVEPIRTFVDEVAHDIASGRFDQDEAVLKFCRLCEALRNHDVICDIHHELSSISAKCDICSRI